MPFNRFLIFSFVTIVLSLLIAIPAPTTHAQFGGNSSTVEIELEHDGRTRSFLLHQPTDASNGPLPLVIALHPWTGNAQMMERFTGMSDIADEHGFLVAYPDGVGNENGQVGSWNGGDCCGVAAMSDVDDVGFLTAIMDMLIADYNADPNAIFFTGWSNGGLMSYRMACELSDRVVGIASVAGPPLLNCDNGEPVAVMIIHGTGDPLVRYDGDYGGNAANSVIAWAGTSIPDTAEMWANINGCTRRGDAQSYNNDDDVEVVRYSDCAGEPVELVTIMGGGHGWPGIGIDGPRDNDNFSGYPASDEIWRFFASLIPTS